MENNIQTNDFMAENIRLDNELISLGERLRIKNDEIKTLKGKLEQSRLRSHSTSYILSTLKMEKEKLIFEDNAEDLYELLYFVTKKAENCHPTNLLESVSNIREKIGSIENDLVEAVSDAEEIDDSVTFTEDNEYNYPMYG